MGFSWKFVILFSVHIYISAGINKCMHKEMLLLCDLSWKVRSKLVRFGNPQGEFWKTFLVEVQFLKNFQNIFYRKCICFIITEKLNLRCANHFLRLAISMHVFFVRFLVYFSSFCFQSEKGIFPQHFMSSYSQNGRSGLTC